MAVGSNYFLLLTAPKVASLAETKTAAAVRACVSATRFLAAYCLLLTAALRPLGRVFKTGGAKISGGVVGALA